MEDREYREWVAKAKAKWRRRRPRPAPPSEGECEAQGESRRGGGGRRSARARAEMEKAVKKTAEARAIVKRRVRAAEAEAEAAERARRRRKTEAGEAKAVRAELGRHIAVVVHAPGTEQWDPKTRGDVLAEIEAEVSLSIVDGGPDEVGGGEGAGCEDFRRREARGVGGIDGRGIVRREATSPAALGRFYENAATMSSLDPRQASLLLLPLILLWGS